MHHGLIAESEMQTTQLHNQLHKPDDTAHEETNYIKVQNIQIIPRMHMIVKIEEKNIDIRPLSVQKNDAKVQGRLF